MSQMTRGKEMASQTRVAVVGAWLNPNDEDEDLLDLDLAMRLAEGVAGARAEANEGSTLAAREEEARVVTILKVCWCFGCLFTVN